MDTRVVSCKLCLQNVYIDTTWCIIQYSKKHYECKDKGLCQELSYCNPMPSAPPVDPEYDDELISEIEQLMAADTNLQDNSCKSIYTRIKQFLFSYTRYSKRKYS